MAHTASVFNLTSALGGTSEGEAGLPEFSFSVAEVMGGPIDTVLGEYHLVILDLVCSLYPPRCAHCLNVDMRSKTWRWMNLEHRFTGGLDAVYMVETCVEHLR